MTNFKQFETNIPKSLFFFMHKAVTPFHTTIQKTEESAQATPAFCNGKCGFLSETNKQCIHTWAEFIQI